MGLASGLNSQLGFVAEDTYGTYKAPTRFAEFNNESLKLDIDRINSKGIRAGRRVLHRWAAGVQRVTGDIELELAPQGSGLLLHHMFGAVNTTGASDPYTHTFTPGATDGKSLTVQFNRPDISGTNRVFSYLGCKITDWELNAAVNEFLIAKLSLYGSHETTAESLAAASYPTGFSPFVFTHGSLTVSGSEVAIRSCNLKGSNGFKVDRHFIQGTNPSRPKEPLEAAQREYGGTFVGDFESLTQYNRFVNGTEAALVLAFDAGNGRSLTITTNVRFDGETPNVGGQDLLELNVPFMCVSSTSDAAAITAVLVNGDSAP